MNNARIFLTDYASYNNGTQFEFGHWVDLSQFNDEHELNNYISDHFEECDEKSPLSSPREEIMITDYEGFPEQFYGESGCDYEKIFAWMELDYDNLDDSELVHHWNEYCSENNNENEIYCFDDDFFDNHLGGTKMDIFQMGVNAQINWSDDYIKFNGYGNLESFDNPKNEIDEDELINYLIKNL